MKHPIAKAGLQMMLRQAKEDIKSPDYVFLVEAIEELSRFETYEAFAETAFALGDASVLRSVVDPQGLAELEEEATKETQEKASDGQWSAIDHINAEIDDVADFIHDDLSVEDELDLIYGEDVRVSYTDRYVTLEIIGEGENRISVQLPPQGVRSLIIVLLLALNNLNRGKAANNDIAF